MKTARVQVLLSTYNGQKHLSELLDSVLGQDYPGLEMLIRDDGSTDQTLSVLEQYAGQRNVRVLAGENLGVVGSFFALLEASAPDAAYIAFCDQDDVWKKDKISRAIGILEQHTDEVPTMYCSRVSLVDENLKPLGFTEIPRRGAAFGNALVQNIATGCTIVINNAARRLLLKEIPTRALVHDWWIYQVVSAFGRVIYDEESRLLYRQHSANTIGEKSTWLEKWAQKAVRFVGQGRIPSFTVQAREFGEIYGDLLPQDKKVILNRFLHERGTVWGRVRYALWGETYRQGRLDDFIYRALVVLNRI